MSPVSLIGQITYLHNQYCIKSLLLKQKMIKKSNKERKIRKYGYKIIANAFLSFFKPTKHLVYLCTRETIFLKAFTLLLNLNKYMHYARKQ